MLLIIYLFVILPGISYAFLYGAIWIIDKHPNWRPTFSIIASCISAYAVSFVFDMIIRVIISDLTFRNILLPAISWGVLSMTMYYVSKELAKHKIQLSTGFYVFGIIAIYASFFGHSYNLYVGLLLFLIGVLSNVINAVNVSSHRTNSFALKETEESLEQEQQTKLPTNQQRMEENSRQILRILKAKEKAQMKLDSMHEKQKLIISDEIKSPENNLNLQEPHDLLSAKNSLLKPKENLLKQEIGSTNTFKESAEQILPFEDGNEEPISEPHKPKTEREGNQKNLLN